MMEFGLQPMPLVAGGEEPQSFMAQLQDGQPLSEPPVALDDAAFDLSDLAAKNRNRGNYRCSKVRPAIGGTGVSIGPLMGLCVQCEVRRAEEGPRVSAGAVELQVQPLRTAQEGVHLRRCGFDSTSALGIAASTWLIESV